MKKMTNFHQLLIFTFLHATAFSRMTSCFAALLLKIFWQLNTFLSAGPYKTVTIAKIPFLL